MKKYLLVYADNLADRQKLVDVLTSMSEVKHWRYDMPNSFYILSDASPEDLLKRIRALCGGSGRCVLVAMNTFFGFLPQRTWDFLHRED